MNTLLVMLPVFWPNMPPLGIAYLQSYLGKLNISAQILDLNNIFYNLADIKLKKQWLLSCNVGLENDILSWVRNRYPEELDFYISKILSYDWVGFSCFNSNFKTVCEFAKVLQSKNPDLKIILGGPEISRIFFKGNGAIPQGLLDLADYFVVGEGEKPAGELLSGKAPLGKVIEFSQLSTLDQLAFPKFEGINFNTYPRPDSIALQFSRGCIRKCNFCSERLLYRGYKTRPVANIIEEIRSHLNKGIKQFIFFDSILNAQDDKLEEFLDAVIANFGSINWEAQFGVRVDMSQDLLEKTKKSGCYNLFIGLESGCDNTLKLMNKGFTSLEALAFFKKLSKAKLNFGISLITGYPQESEQDFLESMDFVIKNKEFIPKIEQINPFVYYDGTPVSIQKGYDFNVAADRMQIFVDNIKKNNIKYTKAFIGNLIKKDPGHDAVGN